MSGLIVDLFAGPGGWDEGARMIGRTDIVGLEWDDAACRTAKAAGHARIRCDVAQYPAEPFAGVEGVIASPPCQAWSMAGKRKGEHDRVMCHRLADRLAEGDVDYEHWPWADPRSHLVCQPVRWVRDLHPQWVALEEVPAVASLWEHFGRIFRGWGYSVWTGDLNSANYGVPQTRTRRILMAHRELTVQPPEPTHAETPTDGDLFGGPGLARWVSMAQALGWQNVSVESYSGKADDLLDEHAPAWTLTSKGLAVTQFVSAGVTGEGRPKDPGRQPADTLAGKGTAYWIYRGSNQAHAAKRHLDEPAPVVNFAERANKVEWMPAELAADPAASGVRVSVQEGGILQSFPANYPWRGSRTKQYQQVGNAIPPRLAAHILAALGVGSLDVMERAA